MEDGIIIFLIEQAQTVWEEYVANGFKILNIFSETIFVRYAWIKQWLIHTDFTSSRKQNVKNSKQKSVDILEGSSISPRTLLGFLRWSKVGVW